MNYVLKKCLRASYLIKLLYLNGIYGQPLWNIAEGLVFSHIAYCWPVFCDASASDFKPFIALDKRLSILCKQANKTTLKDRLNNQCMKLAKRISNTPGHPLEECFAINTSTNAMVLRKIHKFRPLKAHSNLLSNSFTKFA